ncbi:hypothetical protein [Hyphomonas oceanitis]
MCALARGSHYRRSSAKPGRAAYAHARIWNDPRAFRLRDWVYGRATT